MEEASSATKKGTPGLTIDRAAFLLLRVKKAFKKKRQQRKEKQAAQAAAALAAQTCGGKSSRGRPAPLLRSRTLPAIIVPGISILHTQIDPNRLHTEGFPSTGFAARLSLQPRTSPRISLTSDDSSLDYRRRSADSRFPTTSTTSNNAINNTEPYIYAFDDLERHADGTVVLRIPAPHVVAARAYRMSGGSTSGPSGAAAVIQSNSSCSAGITVSVSAASGQATTSSQGGTALYKLARLLNQSSKTSSSSPVLKDDAPRRLSWERRDQNNRLPRSASIDSMVEAVWSESPRTSLTPSTAPMPMVTAPQPSPKLLQVNYAETPSRRESLLSPSTGRRSSKAFRGISELTLPQSSLRDGQCQPTSPIPSTRSEPAKSPQNLVPSSNFPQRKPNKSEMEFLIPHPPTSSRQPRQVASSQNGTFVRSHSINEQSHHQLMLQHQQQKQQQQQQHQLHNQFNQHQTKMTKKQLKLAQAQLNKLTQINIHLHALFSAVEHGHLEKARTILESTDVDVNSVNSDGLAPLDVAVLSNNRSMTKMLLQHGATDRTQFKGNSTLGNHLNSLLRDAENRIQELGSAEDIPQTPYSTRASFSSIIGNAYTGPSVTGCTGTETDKQIGLWERRVKGLRRMLLGWDQARPPDPPNSVIVDVVGPSSVSIRIYEPIEGPLGTKFKVQWSSKADFSNIVGECDITEWNSFQGTMGATCRIGDLTQGRRYFFRACMGNVKGFGQYRTSCPSSVVPSSWYDVEQRENRFVGRQRVLDELFAAVRLARPEDASNIPLETPALQRRNPKKKTTIKQLFSAASKFQKNLRRGIYLACILYHEDKVLVTNEDFIPVIEIDETYPGCLHTDYHWLMKVACTWDDVKSLRTDMERNATSAVHFRTKLLTAACQMQSALCITDLGQLFHKPLRDSHGTVVLCCVNFIKSPKTISVLNSRWIPLNKVHKKLSALHEDNNINEILMNSIQEQINYHQASAIRLGKGLYLGYLKMQSSVDQIQVVVPSKTPNVLPHCKIRDNPHISAEEWDFLKGRKSSIMFGPQNDQPTEVQQLFLEDLTIASHRLFKYMDTPTDDALKHRLYDVEVIELSADVSFLVICPPPEFSCAVPGQREILLQRGDLLSLPIQAFEMIHLRTYQNGIIQKYSRLSCILELDMVLANHSHREAFSTVEVQAAKERLSKLQELTTSLNAVWKGVRWLMDVISFARDRACIPALGMRDILECQEGKDTQVEETKRQLLQPPPRDSKLMKSSPGRGSWPGPAVSSGNGLLVAEHSKSEQHLCVAGTSSNMSSRYLSATSEFDGSSRKNSADSNYSHSGHSYYSVGCEGGHVGTRLPPSRSEDTLTSASKKTPHRKRTTTVNTSFSAASSPLLNIRPTYTSTTESVHSLSSDSESASYPVQTSTPHKSRPQKMESSISMTNVMAASEDPAVGVVRSRKQLFEPEPTTSTAPVFFKPLHIVESPAKGSEQQPFYMAPGPSSGTATRSETRRPTFDIPPGGHNQSAAANPIAHEKVPPGASESSAENTEGAATAEAVGLQASIIQVYAAYETGLASGTSLKLHVTPKTTAREVVDLVVKQLNMAVVLKGREGPIYTADKLDNFCLVAVIGARERCLRDDFKPLQLQNPWKKGRLYVRQKHDLLAAIEHSNREAQMI